MVGTVRNEAMIEVHQSKKSSQLTLNSGMRKFLYDFHLILQWTYTVGVNVVTQEVYEWDTKVALVDIDEDIVLIQLLQYQS